MMQNCLHPKLDKPIIYDGNIIGERLRLGHWVVIREDNTIGCDVSIGSFTEIAHDVLIGNRVRIHSHCFICEHAQIGDDVWIGPGVRLLNDPFPCTGGRHRTAPTIMKASIIGASSTIGPGVVIRPGAMVGCGSLVLEDVPENEMWFGSPAKRQGLAYERQS